MSGAAAVSPLGADQSGPAPRRSAPILIVDDDSSKRLALKSVLAPLGFTMLEADSGAAGLRRVMDDDVAVILLDVRMPVMDGFETAALIRMREETELTPIIFVTAQASDEVGPERYAAGAIDFITAPVDPVELRAKVSVLANMFLESQANAAEARELEATTRQLKLLTEDAPIGIFQTDSENRYTYTNARWSDITGVPASVAIGAEWSVMLDAEQRAAIDDFDSSALGAELSSRLTISPGSGLPRRVAVLTARRVTDEGQASGWVGTLTDITAEVEAEESLLEARDHATEASKLKSDFLANMSHEIRTPMSGVIGWTEVLLETELDDDQLGFVQKLSKAGKSLMSVINTILDFSKIESGKIQIENVEFNLQAVLDELVDLLSTAVEAKGLALTSVIDASVPATLVGDPIRVRQVLSNLIGNAIKFTESGQISIRVTPETAKGQDNHVRFEVTDSGVGIPVDKLAMIFERFTQADTSVTRGYGGTGLGLAISSRLTSLMGGEVGVTSKPGTGSTFWFTIAVPPSLAPAA